MSDFIESALDQFSEFGVDLARRGLETINLGDPSAFVVRFVASAVVGGASFLTVRNDSDEFILEYDGAPYSEREIGALSAGTVPANAPEHFRLLALGVNAAFGANADTVMVESWLGERGVVLTATSRGPKVDAVQDHFSSNPEVTVRVRLVEKNRLRKVTKFVGKFSGLLPEAAVIQRRCRFAPLALTVNGRKVAEPLELGSCLAFRSLVVTEPWGLSPNRPTTGLSEELPSPGPFSAVLGLLPPGENIPKLELVIHGVSYPYSENFGFHGCTGVVACPHFALDQGAEGPAVSEVLNTVTETVKTQFQEMAHKVFEEVDRLPQAMQLEATSLFDEMALKTTDPERLEELYCKALSIREAQLRPNDALLLESRLRLADLKHNQQDHEEAAAIYRRIIPVWEGEAQNHLSKHRHREAIETSLRALELLERITPADDPSLGERYHDFAELCREHRHPKAELFYRRAVALRRNTKDQYPMKLASSLYGLADIYRRQKMLTEAEPVAREALEITEQVHGAESKEIVAHLKLLSQILDGLGDYAGSTDYQRRAMLLKYKR